MKVITILGARPQFIKAAVVSRALHGCGMDESIVHTGQHYSDNMSDVFFRELGIPAPAFQLGVGSASHGRQTGRMLEGIEDVLQRQAPDWVLVYGDTNSTLAGALAAAKLHIPIAHVEAGLRSFNRRMPEEMNRVLTDHAAEVLFAPTDAAVTNLVREGIDQWRIERTGDVMYDAALQYGEAAEQQSTILSQAGVEKGQYILATVHRAENTDDYERLNVIMNGLAKASRTLPVVLPLHPRTRVAALKYGLLEGLPPSLRLMEPAGYVDMVMLEKSAALIATDSGGVQKEAFFHGVPCVTLRTETEWVELVEAGWNVLCPPTDAESLAQTVTDSLGRRPSAKPDLYGKGDASVRIAERLLRGSV